MPPFQNGHHGHRKWLTEHPDTCMTSFTGVFCTPPLRASLNSDDIATRTRRLSKTMVAEGDAAMRNGKNSPAKRPRVPSQSSSDREEAIDEPSPPQPTPEATTETGSTINTRKRIATDTIDYPRRRATIAVRCGQVTTSLSITDPKYSVKSVAHGNPDATVNVQSASSAQSSMQNACIENRASSSMLATN